MLQCFSVFVLLLLMIAFSESKPTEQDIPSLKKNYIRPSSAMEESISNSISLQQMGNMDGSTQEENICRTKKVTVSLGGDVHLYSNMVDSQQTVETEECLEPGNPCFKEEEMLFNIETYCRQEYSRVAYLDMNKRGEIQTHFKTIPTACVCMKRAW